jgi:DNA ligase D-like protein (predicted 3'-phosphoesterase)
MRKYITLTAVTVLIVGLQAMAPSSLKTYRKRRGLTKTKKLPEPYGSIKKKKTKLPLFVIQMHDASHLHYDFRLEIDGVLKSWAVPKGVPTEMGIRRLAMPTDDHPMEYGHFEGIIPEGHYGGGTVMVWDIGTFENIKTHNGNPVSLEDSYKKGTVEIFIYGKKIWGPYALIKTKGLSNKESWILLKMKPRKGFGVRKGKAVKKNISAISGRTLKQIEQDADAVWE